MVVMELSLTSSRHTVRAPHPAQSSRPSWSKVRPSGLPAGCSTTSTPTPGFHFRTLSPMISTKNSSLVRLFHAGPSPNTRPGTISSNGAKRSISRSSSGFAMSMSSMRASCRRDPGSLRHRRRVRHRVDHHRPCEAQRLAKRLAELAARRRPQPDTAERFRDLAEIGVQEAVDLAPIPAQLSAIGGDDESVFLAERRVVVADHYKIDAVTRGRLKLSEVVVKATVATPQHHLAIRRGALHPHGARQAPAQ